MAPMRDEVNGTLITTGIHIAGAIFPPKQNQKKSLVQEAKSASRDREMDSKVRNRWFKSLVPTKHGNTPDDFTVS